MPPSRRLTSRRYAASAASTPQPRIDQRQAGCDERSTHTTNGYRWPRVCGSHKWSFALHSDPEQTSRPSVAAPGDPELAPAVPGAASTAIGMMSVWVPRYCASPWRRRRRGRCAITQRTSTGARHRLEEPCDHRLLPDLWSATGWGRHAAPCGRRSLPGARQRALARTRPTLPGGHTQSRPPNEPERSARRCCRHATVGGREQMAVRPAASPEEATMAGGHREALLDQTGSARAGSGETAAQPGRAAVRAACRVAVNLN